MKNNKLNSNKVSTTTLTNTLKEYILIIDSNLTTASLTDNLKSIKTQLNNTGKSFCAGYIRPITTNQWYIMWSWGGYCTAFCCSFGGTTLTGYVV